MVSTNVSPLSLYAQAGMLFLIFLMVSWNYPRPSGPAIRMQEEGIQTQGDIPADILVKEYFVTGSCQNVDNIERIGNAKGVGYFENAGSVLGIDQGIVLSTGAIENAHGPNEITDRGTNFDDLLSDGDLRQLATAELRDVVGLEFDFVPLDSVVSFRYVFASEEYCEFVGSVFNDVFGFFISGPGISGGFSDNGKNVALIPGTSDFVSINSVNHQENSEYYVDNHLINDAQSCSIDFAPNPTGNQTEFDGFTKVLSAQLRLIPCEEYHIRLVVGDVSDGFYDSAVFLEANSFNIGGKVELTASVEGTSQQTAYEGCAFSYFNFNRLDSTTINDPLTVSYSISPESTASEGIDFETLPRMITIPAGAYSYQLPVTVNSDMQNETPERLVLALDIPCEVCFGDRAELILEDPSPLTVSIPNQSVCRGDALVLEPEISGGVASFGYTYRWSNNQAGQRIEISPSASTTYSVTVSDACGNMDSTEVEVTVQPTPRGFVDGFLELCEGDTAYLDIELEGTPPFRFRYNLDGTQKDVVEGITTNFYQLPVTENGVYRLSWVEDDRCEGDVFGNAQVIKGTLEVDIDINEVSCYGGNDGRLAFDISGGAEPYITTVERSNEQFPNFNQLEAGDYVLHILDQKGCTKEVPFVMPQAEPMELGPLDCDDLADGELEISAIGGTPPYAYSVGSSIFDDASIFSRLTPGELYDLMIRDDKGCEKEETFLMPALYNQAVSLGKLITMELGQTRFLAPQLLIPESLVAKVEWFPKDELSCPACLITEVTPTKNEIYTVRVTDWYGCWTESSIEVQVNRQAELFIPNAFSPNADGNNDIFAIYGNSKQIQQIQMLRIFDRWGELVFESDEVRPNKDEDGWNGQIDGRRAPTGIYVYQVKVELIDGRVEVIQGDLLLMR